MSELPRTREQEQLDQFRTDHIVESYRAAENLVDYEKFVREQPCTPQNQDAIYRTLTLITEARNEMSRLFLGFAIITEVAQKYEETVGQQEMLSDILTYGGVLDQAIKKQGLTAFAPLRDILKEMKKLYKRIDR